MALELLNRDSLGYLSMILGLMYILVLVFVLSKLKFEKVGYAFIGISVALYLYLAYFTTASAYFLDEKGSVLIGQGIGYFELIILSYPYIFLLLACKFSSKRTIHNK